MTVFNPDETSQLVETANLAVGRDCMYGSRLSNDETSLHDTLCGSGEKTRNHDPQRPTTSLSD